MITQASEISRLVLVRMNPGDDIFDSLTEAVRQNGLRNGVILSGAGSLRSYSVHVVETTNLPPGDVFFSDDGPFDILTLTGAVLDGRLHAHITFSNTEKATGGHVEKGCTVLTFAIAVIADTPNTDLTGWDRIGDL